MTEASEKSRHPELLTETFITMLAPSGGAAPTAPTPDGDGGSGADLEAWLRDQLGAA